MSYTPDRGFVVKLKELDEKLGCFFNQQIGLVVVTYKRATGEPVPIYTVKNSEGGFRIPDQRDIDNICKGDQNRTTRKDQLGKVAKYMEEYQAKKRKQAADSIHDVTIDNKYQLKREFGKILNPGGKGDRPFRQIPPPKPKGKIFA